MFCTRLMDYYGRSDFITGIDNEALDFAQLEAFIHGASNSSSNGVNTVISTQSHLPESPQDSGSEPAYSPADLHSLTLNNGPNSSTTNNNSNINNNNNVTTQLTDLQQSHDGTNSTNNQNGNNEIQPLNDLTQSSIDHLNTVAELHVTHHLLGNPNSIYITNEQNDQQNNGHEQILLQQNTSSLLELEHHRNYRNDLLDLGQQPQQQQQSANLSRLIPDVYHQQNSHHHQHNHHPPPHHNNHQLINTRKRKLSQQNDQLLVKPEPGRDLNDVQFVTNHQELIYCPDTQNNSEQQNGGQIITKSSSLSPICTTTTIESVMPNSNIISITNGISQNDNGTNSLDSTSQQTSDSNDHCPLQCIRFCPFQQQNWHILCDQSLQELPIPHYRVDADKGFNFSNSDDAFVCQKKNHFQITCHAQLQGTAVFVRTSSGLEKVRSFHLHFYGVKLEAPTQTIRVEQSQSDRSKKPFHPVPIDLQNGQVSKVTVGRLHFSETTSNNMRKKGRPNPEQRYFQLVVGLHAHTHSGHFTIISHGSERIIVRASNPGQFESDVELTWQRGATQESIYHAGRVGINTDRPDESLVVHGNLKISGHIVHPSDSRAKQEISELDTAQQLLNLQKIRVVRYRYEPEFAAHSGLTNTLDNNIIDTGVIAQEVQKVLPDAVQETGSLILPNGQVIDNFLVVNKERIFMENIGAVKELCKVTRSLETRIEQLETINLRLARIQKLDRKNNSKSNSKKSKQFNDNYLYDDDDFDDSYDKQCSNKMIHIIIIILVVIMAVCLTAISTLYFVEHHKQEVIYSRASNRQYSRYHTSKNFNIDDSNYDLASRNDSYITTHNPTVGHQFSQSQYQYEPQHQNYQYQQHQIQHLATKKNKSSQRGQGGSPFDENETKIQTIVKSKVHGITNSNVQISAAAATSAAGSSQSSSSSDAFLQPDIESNAIDGNQYIEKRNESKYPTDHDENQNHEVKSNLNELQIINIPTNIDAYDSIPIDPEESILNTRKYQMNPIGEPQHCIDTVNFETQCPSACCDDNANMQKNLAEIPAIIPGDGMDFKHSETNATIKPTSESMSLQHQLSGSMFAVHDESPVEIKETNKDQDNNSSDQTQKDDNIEPSQDLGCYSIQLKVHGEQFNSTFEQLNLCKSDDRLNITYLIPISRFMLETQIELHFISPELSEWVLCPRKYKSINYDDYLLNGKMYKKYTTKSIFFIQLPSTGPFEKYMEFRTPLISANKNICHLPSNHVGQYVQYIIKFYRDCEMN